MKKNKDIVHSEFESKTKYTNNYCGTGSYPYHNNSNSSSYPRTTSKSKEPNPLKHEFKILSLESLEKELGLKKGGMVWAYSTVYGAWFFGEVVGENQIALQIKSVKYRTKQEELKFKVADGIFHANRIAKEYTIIAD